MHSLTGEELQAVSSYRSEEVWVSSFLEMCLFSDWVLVFMEEDKKNHKASLFVLTSDGNPKLMGGLLVEQKLYWFVCFLMPEL